MQFGLERKGEGNLERGRLGQKGAQNTLLF